jgi:hypothetical protein
MSLINILNNKEELENLNINENLTIGNLTKTQDLIVCRKITLLDTATCEDSFLQNFVEDLDAETQ